MTTRRDGLGFKILTRLVLPIVILAAAGGAARALFFLAPEAAREAPPPRVDVVETIRVQPTTEQAKFRATGIVEAALEVVVVPEVTGKVAWLSRSFEPGGRFKKGQTLLRLDASEYGLLVKQEKSRVDRAELELKIEKGRQRIAEREWDLIGKGADEEEKELGLRKPHLASSKSELFGAKAGLRRAKLSLGRTVLRAPFNATVVEESVDVGQVVGPSSRLATLIGTDRFWVKVAVPLSRLSELDIPEVNAKEGSKALVFLETGAERGVEHEGRILRLVSRLDPQTRTAQVLVGIDDPLTAADGGVPLLPGAFVTVELEGDEIADVYVIPRDALSNGDRVWVVDENSQLAARTVAVRWALRSELFVTGLSPGDDVVTSPLALPIAGMKVKKREAGEQKPASKKVSPPQPTKG